MKNTNEMNEFVNRNSLVEGQSKELSTLHSRLSTFNSRLSTLVLIVFCLFFSATAWGQQELTIYGNGSATSSYVPVYGLWADAYLKCEYIIPANQLEDMDGGTITKMTFYASSPAAAAWTGTFQVFLEEVAETSISAYKGTSTATIVYEGALDGTGSTMDVNFTSPYEYGGGNLLVGFYQTVKGNYKSITFTGETVSGACVQGYSSSSLDAISASQRDFIPKTTFTFLTTDPYITLSPSSATVLTGFTQSLTATYGNVTNPTITYSSSNTNVATVSGSSTSATVTAVAPGTATITATMNGSYTATCAITVEDPSYCEPNPSSRDGQGITALTFGSGDYVVNNSNSNGLPNSSPYYADYTSMVGSVNAGEEVTVTIDYTTGYNYGTIIWVDWNKNYELEPSEIVFQEQSSTESRPSGTHQLAAGFIVPANQDAGDYRMRIYGSDSGFDTNITNGTAPDACATQSWAVCHDYTLRVISDACPRPTNFHVTAVDANSVTVAWNPNGGTKWRIMYTPADDINWVDADASFIISPDDYTYTITGLETGTTYKFLIFGYCGGDGSSEIHNPNNYSHSIEITATPTCPVPTDVTISNITPQSASVSWNGSGDSYEMEYAEVRSKTYNFDDGTLQGWTNLKVNADGGEWLNSNDNPAGYDYTTRAHSATGFALSYSFIDNVGAYATNVYLVSPQRYQIGTGASLNFWYNFANSSYPDNMEVCVATVANPTASDFSSIWSSSTVGDWTEVNISLNTYVGQSIWIAFHHEDENMYEIWVDDITVNYDGAIVWIPVGTVDSPYTLTGLDSGTEYMVHVLADCGGDGESSWSSPVAFTTLSACTAPIDLSSTDITATSATLSWSDYQDSYIMRYMVYSEDFEEGIPDTWTTIDADGDGNNWLALGEVPTTYPDYSTVPNWAHNGSNAASSPSYANGPGAFNSDHWLISPQIDLGGFLKFYAASTDNTYLDRYEVLLSTTGTATSDFNITLQAMSPALYNGYGWTEVDIDLSNYSGQGYIAIHHVSEDMYFLIIDDFSIWKTFTVSDPTITINQLTPSSDYVWQVRGANCDGRGSWSEYANFTTMNAHTLTTSVNPTNSGTIACSPVSANGLYTEGQSVQLTATSEAGYAFSSWTVDDASAGSTNPYTITMNSDHNVVANFTPITYTISYDLAGGSVETPNPTSYTVETASFTLNNPTKEGYTFAGWTGTGLGGATTTVTIAQGSTGDRSYTATWTENSYAVTFYNGGHGTIKVAGTTVANGGTASVNHFTTKTLAVTANTGYTFNGWTKTGSVNIGNTSNASTTITATATGGTVTATWVPISYNITYNLDGGSVATDNPTSYTIETPTFTLNNPTKTGYTFAGWTGTGLGGATTTVTIDQGSTGNRSYTATWTENSYAVTFYNGGHGTIKVAGVTVANGGTASVNHFTTKTLAVTANTGYTFNGWTKTGSVNIGNTSNASTTITATATGGTVTATWVPTSYNITYNLDGGSVATDNPTNYTIETPSFTLVNPTKTGYTFAGWTGTGLSGATQSVTIAQGSTGNRSYTATWTIDTYNITYDLAGGSVSPANPATYNFETATFTLNNPTRTGYTFAGWTGTDLGGATTTVTIAQGSTGDRSYTATWTENSYAVTFYNGGHGTIKVAGTTVANGGTASVNHFTTKTLAVTANTGYTFNGWTKTGSVNIGNTSNASTTITATATGGTVTATWVPTSYNISYNLDGGSVATDNPTSYTIETPTFTLNNPTKTGYTFAGWTGTDIAEATTTVTITQGSTGNRSYTATWTINNYQIAVSANPSGSVSGGGNYNHFSECTVTASPSTNYCFKNWTEGGSVVSTDASYTFTVTGARTLVANFTHYLEVSDIATVDYCVTGAHAAVSATPTEGSDDYTYTWQKYNGSSWVAAPDASSSDRYTPPYTTTGTVSYRVSVADNNGCAGHNSVVKEFSVKVSDVPSIALSASPVCSGSTLTLEPSVENNGKDVSSSSYQISANNSDWSSFTNGSAVTNEQNGYYIKYTATNGCGSSSQTVQITVNSLPTASIDGPTSVCALKSETIVASGAGDGGSYSWSNDLGTGASKTVAITSNANYTVTVTDANGCMDDETISMTVNIPGNQPMTHVEHGAIWTGYVSNVWSNVNNWVYFDGNYRTLEGLSDTLNLILRTGDSDKCILNNPVISSPTFASNSGMIVRRPITIGEGTELNIDGDLNVESGSITLSSTGALLVTGNANIASGASVAFDNKDTLSIAGNLVLEGTLDFPESDTTPALRLGGNLVIDGGSIEEGGTLVFAGSSTQNVSNGASPLTLNNNVRMNMHRSRAGVPHTVFPDGTIFSKTTIFEYGIMDGNITFDGTGRAIVYGDYESYASGIVTKLGAGNNFTFPTGDDNVLGTITAKIRTGQSAVAKFHHKATGFTIEDGYPRWWNVADMCGADPFNHISNFEYWDFNSTEALSGVMFRTKSATPEEHFHDPSEYPDPDNPDNLIQVAVYDGCWQNTGGELSITPDFTDITISGVGVEARSTRSGAITSIGSKSKTVVLPIELTSFTATCDGRSALVEWTTATERNNDYFSLERSDDAINFTEIARVAGAGNSIEPIDYAYNDYGIHGGDNYYRLVQVDYDGTRTVSEVIVANCIEPESDGDPDVQAYPNPFNGELTLVLDNFSNRAAIIEVYDMLGKLIYTEKASAPQNSYETILNLSNLPSGAYTVRVSTTDFVINKNVVKN